MMREGQNETEKIFADRLGGYSVDLDDGGDRLYSVGSDRSYDHRLQEPDLRLLLQVGGSPTSEWL